MGSPMQELRSLDSFYTDEESSNSVVAQPAAPEFVLPATKRGVSEEDLQKWRHFLETAATKAQGTPAQEHFEALRAMFKSECPNRDEIRRIAKLLAVPLEQSGENLLADTVGVPGIQVKRHNENRVHMMRSWHQVADEAHLLLP